jgi:hypothetical protein
MSELPIKPNQHAAIIVRDFEIESVDEPGRMGEEELFQLLAGQIDFMLQARMEHLFSLLYRLDVKEELVRQAMAPDAPLPANEGLARLVIDRQKQRMLTKATIRQEDLGEEWDW